MVSGTNLNWWFTFWPLQTCWFECDTKNKRIFLSFCVFTIMSHVPTSMYKLLNNLAPVPTIQILHVFDAMFGTRLFDVLGRAIRNDSFKTKNKETKTPPHVLFPGVASATFPQFDTDPSHPKKQPHSRLPYISTNPKRSTHVSQHKAFRRRYRKQ